jgi:multicomponent Na+:H+ antiporter subunit D
VSAAPLLHPVAPFLLAVALMPWIGAAGRRIAALAAPAAALVILASLPDGTALPVSVLGLELQLLRADALGRIFAYAFVIYSFVAGVYAWRDDGVGPKSASVGLAGAGVGVVLAGDLLTLFLFWEWLTVTSLFLIWLGNTPGAWQAGLRYLMFHVAGAMCMLGGIVMHIAAGSTSFEAFATMNLSAWLILVGMVVNAAVPPFHAWLSDAYPRASVFGTVFLAAFTTKAAVYALVRGFPGLDVLVWAGVIMSIFGVVYAVLENDIRRLLAYHIISQVGYMVAGVGLGSALSLNGSSAHAFAHIFYKGLLMMSAGAVIYATGRRKLTELGHLAGPLKWTLVLMMIGAFSISGAPLFNGFVSKSMVVSAAAYEKRAPIEFLLLLSSMGTFLHTGLKLPWFTFFGRDQGARIVQPVPASMYAGMWLAAGICIVTGIAPGATLYRLLPFDASYDPFTAHHFIESVQLLAGTGLGFWLLRSILGGEPTVTRDVDTLYRAPLNLLVVSLGRFAEESGRRMRHVTGQAVTRGIRAVRNANAEWHPPTMAFQSLVVVASVVAAAYFLTLLR